MDALGRTCARDDRSDCRNRSRLLFCWAAVWRLLFAAALVLARAALRLSTIQLMLAGVIAIMIGDRHEPAHVTMERTERLDISTGRGRLRFIAAGVGALGLGLEVLWTHLFAQVLHNSVYSFTAVIVVFLIAIASG